MKTNTKANKLNTISMLALLWLGSLGVFGQTAQQPDWKWQNPLPTGYSLFDVHFVNTQIGWAVGYFGTILKTNNGGNSWSSQTSGTNRRLNSVHFTDAQTGCAVGEAGTILKTSNGGSTWSSQTGGTTQRLSAVHFTDAQTGWVVGDGGTILTTITNNSPINGVVMITASQIGVKLYPNPVTQNQLTVDFSSKGNLILFNAKGQIVYHSENLEGVHVLPIRLKTGLYFARMQTKKGSTIEKVVVLE